MFGLIARQLAALVIASAILAAGQFFATTNYGFDHSLTVGAIPLILLLALSVYVGIFAQVLTSRLKRSKSDQIVIMTEIRSATQSRDFWIAMLASPMVLASAYDSVAQLNSFSLAFVIGFQNGFFFHAVLSSAKASR